MEQKYDGTEGFLIPTEEADKYIEKYTQEFSGREDYTKYVTFSKKFLQEILDKTDSDVLRFYIGKDEQLSLFIKPTDKYGVEKGISYFSLKGDPNNNSGTGPKCPSQC